MRLKLKKPCRVLSNFSATKHFFYYWVFNSLVSYLRRNICVKKHSEDNKHIIAKSFLLFQVVTVSRVMDKKISQCQQGQ